MRVPAALSAPFLSSVPLTLPRHDSPSPAVVVGADRVVANGDTANKVGTYQLAIAAKHHGVPFYVAAPSTSCDLSLESGKDVVIEVRPPEELTSINGVPVAAPGEWKRSFCAQLSSKPFFVLFCLGFHLFGIKWRAGFCLK